MKQISKSALAIATVGCATVFSFGWSEQGGVALSVERAQARVGRPLTPVSGAGVARRQTRRAAYGYGAAGATAIGTAAALGANAYYGGPGYDANGPYYGGVGYHLGAPPYYSGGPKYPYSSSYRGGPPGPYYFGGPYAYYGYPAQDY